MSLAQDTIRHWIGKEGDAYTERNASNVAARMHMWGKILSYMDEEPKTVLEVGANVGQNIEAICNLIQPQVVAIEPNAMARDRLAKLNLASLIFDATASQIPVADGYVDLAFTSGVLIHISPDHLLQSCSEILRCSKRYVVSIEYFSDAPEARRYRGSDGLLWTRDWGQYWVDNFHLRPVACGFEWRTLTELDNLTWWVLER